MLLNTLLDLLLVLILVIASYLGYTRGFFNMLTKPLRLLFCLWFAFSLCTFVGERMILPLIEGRISNIISDFLYEKFAVLRTDQAIEEIPTIIKIAAAVFDLQIDYSQDFFEQAAERLILSVISPTVKLISIAVAFLILLFVSRLMIDLLINVLDSILTLGLIGSVNRILGVLLSSAFGFFAVWGLVTVTDMLLNSQMLVHLQIVNDFSGGPIYKFFQSFSPVRLLLSF